MIPTMRPYRARASAKIKIRIIPTNSFGCWALALTKKELPYSASKYSVNNNIT